MTFSRRGRERIQPYVGAQLRQRLTRYCAAQGITESACVEAALTEYLDQTSDRILFMRRLDRLGRQTHRLERDQQLTLETLAAWIHIWFAHTPSIPDEAKSFATAQAESRYHRFTAHVARKFSGGPRFIDDLPKETFQPELADEQV